MKHWLQLGFPFLEITVYFFECQKLTGKLKIMLQTGCFDYVKFLVHYYYWFFGYIKFLVFFINNKWQTRISETSQITWHICSYNTKYNTKSEITFLTIKKWENIDLRQYSFNFMFIFSKVISWYSQTIISVLGIWLFD